MKRYPVFTNFFDYVLITIGAFIMAFAIKNIYAPVNLVTGGVSGLSIILNKMAYVPLWVTSFVINVILFIAGLKLLGWKYIRKTTFTTAMLSFALAIIPSMNPFNGDMIISAIFGGVCTGVGVGLIVRCGTSTGGTDTLAYIIRLKLKDRSVVEIMRILDGIVVIIGIYFFGIKPAMYALITVYVVTWVSDGIVEGVNFSKQAFIVSDKSEEIAKAIMEKLHRGVTEIDAKGMYTRKDKQMLFCVIRRKEITPFKEIVASIDKNAFVILSDSKEVFGGGFIKELN